MAAIGPKSGVWDYFTRLAGEKAECKLCPPDTTRKRVFDTPKKTTGSLHNHLRSYHKLEHSLLNAKKDLTGKRARQCAEFLAEHPECSPAMFHSQTFLSFFPENEWSTFPSRTIIPKMISEVKETNKKDLAGVPGCIVTDGWTSKGGKVILTAVLFYYIADDFSKMEGRLLAVKKTTGRHTADAIQALLEEVIKEYDLNVTSIMSDSAANVRKAVEQMELRKGGASAKMIKEFARTLNTSAPIRDEYFQACEESSLRPITVPNSVETRWGSELRMISAALKQMPAVNATLEGQGKRKVSDSEVLRLQQTAKILAPYDRFTTEMSREGNMLSESLFVLQELKKHLENTISSETGSARKLAQLLMKELEKKWGNYFEDDDVLMSAFFDPSAIFNFKDEIDWKGISSKFKEYFFPCSGTHLICSNVQSQSNALREYAVFSPIHSIDICCLKLQGWTHCWLSRTEISLYLDQCIRGIDANHEALDFWRINHTKYPRLALLAREFLCSPPTSVSAERIFSAAGLIYRNHLKNRLSAEHAEEILLLRMNYFEHKTERVLVKKKDFRVEEEVMGELEEEEEREMEFELEEDEVDENGARIVPEIENQAEEDEMDEDSDISENL